MVDSSPWMSDPTASEAAVWSADVAAWAAFAPCRFRFRYKHSEGWERRSLTLMPRSAYLLRGAARHEWQHSIPPVEALRYSVTFRSTR